ncbi:hypothetical protein I6J71_15800 [Amycolatopsis sp. FDAARGOS 1241]|nr:hypothetical protein I6J71_15800 [Amycolatopsis sp. FDAARGOS 1241]
MNNIFSAPDLAGWLDKPFWELPIKAWDEVLGIGARSHYVASVHAAALLFAAGGGLIANISSSGAAAYTAGHRLRRRQGRRGQDDRRHGARAAAPQRRGRVPVARSRARRTAGLRRPPDARGPHGPRHPRRRRLRPRRGRVPALRRPRCRGAGGGPGRAQPSGHRRNHHGPRGGLRLHRRGRHPAGRDRGVLSVTTGAT